MKFLIKYNGNLTAAGGRCQDAYAQEYMVEDYVYMSGDTVHYLENMYAGA
jgi:hypothetical protein